MIIGAKNIGVVFAISIYVIRDNVDAKPSYQTSLQSNHDFSKACTCSDVACACTLIACVCSTFCLVWDIKPLKYLGLFLYVVLKKHC
jgi:hypothetical protein